MDPWTEARVRQFLEEAFSSLLDDDPLKARRALRSALHLAPEHPVAKQMLEEIERGRPSA
jgi:hypothetical protein